MHFKMNERIKELWIKAGANTLGETVGDQVQEFAELIVQECIDHFCIKGAIGVKNHFGVEE